MLLIKIIDLAGLVLEFCLIAWAGWFYHIPMLVTGLLVLVGREVVLQIARHKYEYNDRMLMAVLMAILDAIAYRWPF